MSEWILCKDRLPDKEMKLLVLIGDKVFEGESYFFQSSPFFLDIHIDIYFEISKTYDFGALIYSKGKNGWIVPSHYKEPTAWMELPKLTKENK